MDPLRKSVQDLSRRMQERTRELAQWNRSEWKEFLKSIGTLESVSPATAERLNHVQAAGGLLAVDASYQRFGGAAPHYLELYQGLGVSSCDMRNPLRKVSAHTPMLTDAPVADFSFSDGRSKETEARLAAVELETAAELVEQTGGYALIMDGSLIRFQILCPELWEALRSLCAQKNMPVIGVIEEVKTDGIGRVLETQGHARFSHYDKEILSGRLAKGEVFFPGREISGKAEQGISTLFARFSNEPHVIGIDMAGDAQDTLRAMAEILYAITPAHGRGIPYLLDIVDEKARLEDKRVYELMKRTLDPDVLEMYFVSARSRRRI